MNVPYTIRPIDTWPAEPTRNRRSSPFSARNSDTLDQLARELGYLGAKNVVMLMAVREQDIRLDGQLRANARPEHPGIVLAFDSIHGPLKYAVDTFADAWSNIRAIALGLEALRRVDRYGITKRGEQYTGWKQLGAGTPMPAAMTLEDAAEFLVEHGAAALHGTHRERVADVLNVDTWRTAAYREAARRLHPDTGGTTADFQRLQQARDLIEAHA